MPIIKKMKSLLAMAPIYTLPFSQAYGDSHYLTNNHPLYSTQQLIREVKSSDSSITWREFLLNKHILNSYNLESKVTSSIATSKWSFASIQINGTNTIWRDIGQPGSYFIWSNSQTLQKISTSCNDISALFSRTGRVIYECSGVTINQSQIVLMDNIGTITNFSEKRLLGENNTSLVIDNSTSEGGASIARVDIYSKKKEIIYSYPVKDSYISRYIKFGDTAAWILGEKVLAQSAPAYSLIYQEGKSILTVRRDPPMLTEIDLSQDGLFWNEWNAAKNRYDLNFWSPTKGKSTLTNSKIPLNADRFSVWKSHVYISNGKTIYQTDLVEYPAVPPHLSYKRINSNPESMGFSVDNPVQGKIYTLQAAFDLQGPWRDLSSIATTDAKDVVSFSYPMQNNAQTKAGQGTLFPSHYFRVAVNTP